MSGVWGVSVLMVMPYVHIGCLENAPAPVPGALALLSLGVNLGEGPLGVGFCRGGTVLDRVGGASGNALSEKLFLAGNKTKCYTNYDRSINKSLSVIG